MSELLDAIIDQAPAPDPGEDIALLALRIPATSQHRTTQATTAQQ
ncbi:hypothetical protein [Streptomyces microflavus]